MNDIECFCGQDTASRHFPGTFPNVCPPGKLCFIDVSLGYGLFQKTYRRIQFVTHIGKKNAQTASGIDLMHNIHEKPGFPELSSKDQTATVYFNTLCDAGRCAALSQRNPKPFGIPSAPFPVPRFSRYGKGRHILICLLVCQGLLPFPTD